MESAEEYWQRSERSRLAKLTEKRQPAERVDIFKITKSASSPPSPDTGRTKHQVAADVLEQMAKARQAKTGEDYFVAYEKVTRSPEARPYCVALYARDAHLTSAEIAKAASADIDDLKELLKIGAPTFWAWIQGECERRSPGHWEDSLSDVALEYPDRMAKARAGR
jgi:hypothetical protein